MKVKVLEASNVILDLMVAKAEGLNWFIDKAYFGPVYRYAVFTHPGGLFNPTERWDLGGLIIDREQITIDYRDNETQARKWSEAECGYTETSAGKRQGLVAAMRCYVVSKLGEEVEVPEEVLK